MANIIDATAPVAITVLPQGLAVLQAISSNPAGPVNPGTTVTVRAEIRNTGTSDTIWATLFANNTSFGTWEGIINPGSLQYVEQTYVVNENTTFSCDCGHKEGATYIIDHSHTSAPFVTVNINLFPEAAFYGPASYNPGQYVEPGTPVTISYQVINTATVSGLLWGGLYDYATPTPNLIGGYWEQTCAPGATLNKNVTIVVEDNLTAQLLVGHFE